MEHKFRSNYHREASVAAEARRKAIREKRAKGTSWTDIAREYGITPQRAMQLGTKRAIDIDGA